MAMVNVNRLAVAWLVASGCLIATARAQSENPVYVDDSPAAWELFQQAQDQAANNAGEAVRLYQELLDEFTLKLVPVSGVATDHYEAVRQRVHEALADDEALLARYRLIQTPQAELMLQNNELERLAMTRLLTTPGLEALLRLGQRELESGRSHAALAWLNQALAHTDLAGRRAAHCHSMMGLASHYLDDEHAANAALAALVELGPEGDAFHAYLNHQIAQDARPMAPPAITSLDRGEATNLDDLVAQAIWSVPLEDSLLRRRFARRELEQDVHDQGDGQAVLDQRLRDADLTTAVATVAGPVVYVNQGHSVLALNRLTGRVLWTYADVGRLDPTENERHDALDLSVISANDRSVVTLTGHAQAARRSEGGKIICLDPLTGSLRWPPRTLNGLVEGAADEELFPHGAPVLAEGMIFIAARKVSPQLLTSAYVVALDEADGSVRWTRHISSSGGLRMAPRPFCSVVYGDGALYVATAVGAAARLEPATGEIRWLRRFNVPISPLVVDQGRRPWELTAPVVTPRGVLAMQPDQRRIVLLDGQTGDLLESHSASGSADWNMPRYLLADDERVYAVGTEVRAFSLDELETPLWSLPAAAQQTPEGRPARSTQPTSIELRGRVQLLEGALILPTSEGVLVVDHETGLLKNKIAVGPIGNPLAVESQLLLTCGDRIDSYMSFSKAQAMLRERIEQAPREPEPALSLLRLGMRVRDLPLALEAADLAMGAINQLAAANPAERLAHESRAELFALLLELAAADVASTVAEGESVFAAIGAVANDPEQRVEHLLAYGAWLSNHALDKSVESYQTILSDPALASSLRSDEGVTRAASAWASQRLADLIQKRGAAVYAPQADYAAVRLQQITTTAGGAEPNPQHLVALALEFPLSDAAIEAAVKAAAIHQKRGQPRAALAALTSLYHAAPRHKGGPQLLAAFARVSQNAGWRQLARSALGHVIAMHGDIPLTAESGERRPSAWLASLHTAAADTGAAPPRLGMVAGETAPIRGAVVSYHPLAAHPPLRDRVLVRDGNTISLLMADQLQPAWTATVEGEGAQLVHFDDRTLILWMEGKGQEPKATMLDAKTGQLRWVVSIAAVLPESPAAPSGRTRGGRDTMPDGEQFDPTQVLPLVTDASLVLVGRRGAAAAIDLKDGRTIFWSKPQILEQVHLVALHEGTLVLAGMGRELGSGRNELLPRIAALDPRSGQPLLDDQASIGPRGRGGVKWMKITPLGLLIYGAAEGIDAVDLYSGVRRWSSTAYAALDTRRGWQLDSHLIIEDQRNRLRSIDVRQGTISEPFEMPARGGEWEPLDLREVMVVGPKLAAHYPRRVVLYEPATGALAGNDVISDEREYRWLFPFDDAEGAHRILVINSRSEQVVIGAQPGMRNQYVYLLYTLSDNGMVLADPRQHGPMGDKVQHVAVINGWVLLSTATDTWPIPMPAD